MSTNQTILPPPFERFSVLKWLRDNLFQNWFSGVVTVVSLYVIFVTGRGILVWTLTQAKWQVITANIQLLMVGQYPSTQLWRIWILVGILGLLAGLSWGLWINQRPVATILMLLGPFLLVLFPGSTQARLQMAVVGVITVVGYLLGKFLPRFLKKPVIIAWAVYLPLAFIMVRGWSADSGPMPVVDTDVWGGLMLTSLIAAVGIILSYPLGVILAVGRMSRYPLMRAVSIVYIELIRSVPLISVFFMAQTMLPLFLPSNIDIDRVVRAMIAFTLFSAAYMAESVRGGLQAVPKGQHEAAAALGLSNFDSLRLVVFPQALKNILPILTASVIGDFRDTSLVMIVGLLDLLGIARVILAQPAFLGRHIEVYSFLAAIYWLISYIMSYIGQTIEAKVGLESKLN